ncbi:hypothetical protein [Nonomuraea basaltis]|uniref:hypothetical protein n=1 Tax=Nonomuraea basaltis TaxID=2495887 RepID=UPI00110C51BD|nr:hypothetical protein [Nonomuraea basaltis]TMR99014.1 hypothetical protein EJK15_09635 [Nonomuraea basaltis]
MAFLSRLFKRGDPLAEREEARRQGMRDARQHPLGEFTDPEFQPAYVTEIRARAREQITEVDRRLAVTRTALLEQAAGARELILRELGRIDTRPESAAQANGHVPPGEDGRSPDAFISIAESRARRAEARRRGVVEEANTNVQRARARIEHLTQEWESALIERDHEVEAVHARAEQLIAAYKGGVLQAHPRKEEIPSLWKGEVIAITATGDTSTAISGREEIGRILREVEDRIEVWRAEVMPRQLTSESRRQLSPAPDDASDDHAPDDAQNDPPSSHDAPGLNDTPGTAPDGEPGPANGHGSDGPSSGRGQEDA